MAVYKCKMCGGTLGLIQGETVAVCEYCDTKQTVPVADDEKKMNLFARANRLRFSCDFDKAASIYESIIADFPEEAEAYWGLILCKYGIEYVDDPLTAKKIPTCHRSSFESVLDDENFEFVMENSDSVSRSVYREEAKQIEELRKGIIEVSAKEEPYDIFICYKETDENGDRTIDSVIAQDVYNELTEKEYRVFFSRITLEDKLGQEYEPYIFAALNSAKVMLAFGTDYEYYNAVWVKNEWSRYLQLIAKGEKKTLIPCYKNIDAYDMPKEFAKLQAQDMGKVGAVQDLLRGIEKIIPKNEPVYVKETVIVNQSGGPNVDALLKRAFMFLEDGDFASADEYCEKVLDMAPECAEAYLGKLMAELNVKRQEDLKDCRQPFYERNNYKKTLRFAHKELSATLEGYVTYIIDKYENERLEKQYNEAMTAYNYIVESFTKGDYDSLITLDFENAAKLFEQISFYKDSSFYVKKCYDQAKTAENDCVYRQAKSLMYSGIESKIIKAKELFKSISGYRDSDECIELAETERKNVIYKAAVNYAKFNTIYGLTNAIDSLQKLDNWKDSKEKIAEYKNRIDVIKDSEYTKALENVEKDTIESLKEAITYLSRLGEYKDSKEKIVQIEKQLEELKRAELQRKNRQAGFCQHCGGELKGLFTKKCSNCGKVKDY